MRKIFSIITLFSTILISGYVQAANQVIFNTPVNFTLESNASEAINPGDIVNIQAPTSTLSFSSLDQDNQSFILKATYLIADGNQAQFNLYMDLGSCTINGKTNVSVNSGKALYTFSVTLANKGVPENVICTINVQSADIPATTNAIVNIKNQ